MDIGKTRDLITAKLSSMHTRFARGETVHRDEFKGAIEELRAAAEFLPLAPVPAPMGDLGGAAPRPPTPVDVPAARVEGAMHSGIIENEGARVSLAPSVGMLGLSGDVHDPRSGNPTPVQQLPRSPRRSKKHR